ncbi:MAG: metal ABC transporter permease [Synergistaceae bacterium]|jgi:zinc transport system permease protein|nr:metal ABC transporter permease [Synergistaceae bacterium]
MFEIFHTLSEMFSYTFLVRAFVVGLLVSLCASLLGVSLVLKRYSMIGDGLSHVGFGALAVAMALNVAPLAVSIPVVVIAAFLLLRISENSRIKGDSAIALISTSSLAIGVMLISVTTGMNTDVCNYMFGSILAMTKNDVYLSVTLSIVVLILFVLFYNKIFAVTFDETFAKATGVRTQAYNMLIAFLSAVTIVIGMRMMGALLISSLIIFPALSSMRIYKRFKTVVISSAVISVVCFFLGIVISYQYATPTGASVVSVNLLVFLALCAVSLLSGKFRTRRVQQ